MLEEYRDEPEVELAIEDRIYSAALYISMVATGLLIVASYLIW
jgi:hypothetical protein